MYCYYLTVLLPTTCIIILVATLDPMLLLALHEILSPSFASVIVIELFPWLEEISTLLRSHKMVVGSGSFTTLQSKVTL